WQAFSRHVASVSFFARTFFERPPPGRLPTSPPRRGGMTAGHDFLGHRPLTSCHSALSTRPMHRGLRMHSRQFFALLVPSVVALAGCGGDEPAGPAAEPELLAPPAAGQGVQYKMVTELEPGMEAEHCMFVK